MLEDFTFERAPVPSGELKEKWSDVFQMSHGVEEDFPSGLETC